MHAHACTSTASKHRKRRHPADAARLEPAAALDAGSRRARASARSPRAGGRELDTLPREVTVPPDFAHALDHDAQARRFFDGLSYSNRLRYVLSIEAAKSDETRQRRIARSVAALRAGRT